MTEPRLLRVDGTRKVLGFRSEGGGGPVKERKREVAASILASVSFNQPTAVVRIELSVEGTISIYFYDVRTLNFDD